LYPNILSISSISLTSNTSDRVKPPPSSIEVSTNESVLSVNLSNIEVSLFIYDPANEVIKFLIISILKYISTYSLLDGLKPKYLAAGLKIIISSYPNIV
jgi:hypothetical protein